MKTLNYRIKGTAPLLMHSDKTANPLHPLTKKLKELTKKRNKTDEDLEAIARVEFEAGCYYEGGKYLIPASVLDATFLSSAKMFKQGVLWKQAAFIPNDAIFEFKHSKIAPDKLFDIPGFADIRTVKVGQAKTMRCRPVFSHWEFSCTIILDEAKLNESEIDNIVKNAGLYVGICDYRPRFGRFEVEKEFPSGR
jgi:hypothetical protein